MRTDKLFQRNDEDVARDDRRDSRKLDRRPKVATPRQEPRERWERDIPDLITHSNRFILHSSSILSIHNGVNCDGTLELRILHV